MPTDPWCRLSKPSHPRATRIENRSRFDTGDIRRLVRAAMQRYRMPPIHVRVLDHPERTRGCARIGGRELVLALGPRADREVAQVARILRHELAHLAGLDHPHMEDDLLYSEGPAPQWAHRLRLRPRSRRTSHARS